MKNPEAAIHQQGSENTDWDKIAGQESNDDSPLKIRVINFSTKSSKEINERLRGYEQVEPTEWELEAVNSAVDFLNDCRQKYGDKSPIPRDTVKLHIIANEKNLSTLLGDIKNEDDGDTGGFVANNGEIFVGGGWRDDPIQIAHIIIHEMTHYFSGIWTVNCALNKEEMEAVTELVATEALANFLFQHFNGSLSYTDVDGKNETATTREQFLELAENYYQTYTDFINDIKEKRRLPDGSFDIEGVKTDLFGQEDRVIY